MRVVSRCRIGKSYLREIPERIKTRETERASNFGSTIIFKGDMNGEENAIRGRIRGYRYQHA